MSLDYNAHACALKANDMTEDDVYRHVYKMRALVAELLQSDQLPLSSEKRTQLEEHSEALRKVLTPMFHPVGIHSDPFRPKYRAERILYFADERGVVILVAERDGTGIMLPAFRIANDEFDVDDKYVQGQLKAKAEEWELPFKEPYVAVEPSLETELARAYDAAHPKADMGL
jgi:hypothetical protein